MKYTNSKVALICFLFFSKAGSQTLNGLQNSNFAGVHSVYSNPALLTSMAYKRHANVSTFSAEVNTNLVSLTAPFTLWQAMNANVPAEYLNDKGKVAWKSEFLQAYPVGMEGWAFMGLEWRGPSYAKRVGQCAVWATHSRSRSNISVKNVSDATLSFARLLLDSGIKNKGGLEFLQSVDKPFSFQANAYQELGASVAFALVDAKKLKVSVGATAKYIMGLGHVSIATSGFKINSYVGDSLVIQNSNVQVSYSESQVLQRMMRGVILGGLPSFRDIIGSGVGFDFGISVEGGKGGSVVQFKERWLGDPTVRNYHWRLAASLLDWGQVSYKNQVKSFSMSNTTPVTLKTDAAFLGAFAQGSAEGFAYLEQFARDNMNYSEEAQTQQITLPTQLQIQGDMRLMSRLYASFHWQQSLVNAKAMGFRQPSSLIVSPRIETKWLEVAMPMGLTQDYRKGNIGAFVRVGPVFLGSDNLVTNMMSNNIKGINLYFGVSTSVGKFKKK
ncbi:MAG: hypothetical protein RLZZ510_70 [Bacteroidota bacterium]|jgi:hypothetical protein